MFHLSFLHAIFGQDNTNIIIKLLIIKNIINNNKLFN